MTTGPHRTAAGLALAAALALLGAPAPAEARESRRAEAAPSVGRTQHGTASYYHPRLKGRRMANGERFDPDAAIAAHRTLPFGTVLRVTNLGNGRSALVRVADRGPAVPGRIIDLAPRVAERLDMKDEGLARVAVTPLRGPEEAP